MFKPGDRVIFVDYLSVLIPAVVWEVAEVEGDMVRIHKIFRNGKKAKMSAKVASQRLKIFTEYEG